MGKVEKLETKVSKLEKYFESFKRFVELNDGRFKEPNAYLDWNFKDAVRHSELIRWTELDKRSSDYALAKILTLEMMLNSTYANSRLLDKDHYFEGNVLDLFNVETVGIDLLKILYQWKSEYKKRLDLEKSNKDISNCVTLGLDSNELPFVNNDKIREFLGMDMKTVFEAIEHYERKIPEIPS